MEKRIIYKTPEGGIVILAPTYDCLKTRTVEEIALKDVPFGLPFKIVNFDEIPTDRTFRNAWTVDEADLTDGVGAESNQFPE